MQSSAAIDSKLREEVEIFDFAVKLSCPARVVAQVQMGVAVLLMLS